LREAYDPDYDVMAIPQARGRELQGRYQGGQQTQTHEGMNILVDSAIYIGLLRSGQDARQVLLPALRGCELYNCGVIRAEVLRGFRESKIRDVYESFFDIIPRFRRTRASGVTSARSLGNSVAKARHHR